MRSGGISMCDSMKKLIGLLLRCMVFGLAGGALFTVISGTTLGLLPYAVCMGIGSGWRLTKPIGVIVTGTNGIIFTVFCFAVRLGLALIVGWLVLIPYGIYLVAQVVLTRKR